MVDATSPRSSTAASAVGASSSPWPSPPRARRSSPPLALPGRAQAVPAPAAHPSAALGRLRRAIEADDDVPPPARRGRAARAGRSDRRRVAASRRRVGGRVAALVAAADARPRRRPTTVGALRRAEKRRDGRRAGGRPARGPSSWRCRRGSSELTAPVDGAAPTSSSATRGDVDELRGASWPTPAATPATPTTGPRRRGTSCAGVRGGARRGAPPRRGGRGASATPLLADRAERGGVERVRRPGRRAARPSPASARGAGRRLAGLIEVGADRRSAAVAARRCARDSQRRPSTCCGAGALGARRRLQRRQARPGPTTTAPRQRTCCLDLVDDLARRFGSDITVVFDGADVVGAHADRRRIVRVVLLAGRTSSPTT